MTTFKCSDCGCESDSSDGWVYDLDGNRLFCESCQHGVICRECGAVMDSCDIGHFGDATVCPDCRTVEGGFLDFDDLPACGPHFQWAVAYDLYKAKQRIVELEREVGKCRA